MEQRARCFFIVVKGLLDKPRIGALKNTAVIDKATQATHCVCASAKAKEINLIARGVVLHDIAVTIHDIFMQPTPCRAANHFIVIGANTPVVKHLLRFTIGRNRANRPRQTQHIGGKIHLKIFLGSIPSPVSTNHNTFIHRIILELSMPTKALNRTLTDFISEQQP